MTSYLIRKTVTCFLLCLFLLASCGDPDGNPENGKIWYDKNDCSSCHGENGKGGDAPDITGQQSDYKAFVKKLRTPNSPFMPSFSKQEVSRQGAADMYSWLKGVK